MSNNSLLLGHFLPSSLLPPPPPSSSSPLRRLTSTSSDSEDSGVDSSYRQERKIFVGGVPSSVGPEELAQFFQNYGTVEEAFIIYDRYTGRHRGFGFVTFAEMLTTKNVCSIRVFHLHGRKIECKRALKREEILGSQEGDGHHFKSFRPNQAADSSSKSAPFNALPIPFCSSSSHGLSYGGESNQSSVPFLNPINGWLLNPSLPPLYPPIYNPHPQYAVFPFSTLMWPNAYPSSGSIPSPFIQEMLLPCSAPLLNF